MFNLFDAVVKKMQIEAFVRSSSGSCTKELLKHVKPAKSVRLQSSLAPELCFGEQGAHHVCPGASFQQITKSTRGLVLDTFALLTTMPIEFAFHPIER